MTIDQTLARPLIDNRQGSAPGYLNSAATLAIALG